jgi:DNA-binding NarL/FixJ family response regulator
MEDVVSKHRVIVADDHRLVAEGLERLLAPEYEIVSVALDGTSLLRDVRAQHPDLVVQDMSLPPLPCTDTIRAIHQIDPRIRIVIVTMWDDAEAAAEAFRAGASAYVLKNCAASELLAATRCVMQEGVYVTPLLAGRMIRALTSEPSERRPETRLTPRQREILTLLASGKSMKEAAAIMNVATRTVAYHKYRLMEMLNIRSSAELVRFAITKHIA